MEETYTISYKENASQEEENILIEGIILEAVAAKEMSRIKPFSFFVTNSKNTILGGVKGTSLYGCLYIDLLWISPECRNKGFGSQLMNRAEQLGKERLCTFVSLTTMDWEALPFYQKLGYQIEYVRTGYEKESKMFVLRKNI